MKRQNSILLQYIMFPVSMFITALVISRNYSRNM